MPIWDRDLQIKKWDPRILLHSGRNALLAWLGVGETQFTMNNNAFSNVKTIKKTIGYPGSTGNNFTWTSGANTTAQNKDLGAVLPAYARLLDVKIITNNNCTGAVSLTLRAGNAAGGNQFIDDTDHFAANTVSALPAGGAYIQQPGNAASNIHVKGTPGANWNLMTAGKVSVYISYLEI